MILSRRDVLGTALCLGLSSKLFPLIEAAAAASAGTIRVRQNVSAFARDAAKVSALRLGVKRMKERSTANPHDPGGWSYWAAIHGTSVSQTTQDPKDPNGKQLYRQCKHTRQTPFRFEPHFISWHRPFLYFFEVALKAAAAEAGATTAFELPYWDWYTQPKMPAIFVASQNNSLHHERLRSDLSGFALDKSPFRSNNMLPGNGVSALRTFPYLLEIDPHGAVHDLIGGDMGRIQTSARDPIFWLHHANIDRLWSAWMKGANRVVPAADSAWANEGWFFVPRGERQSAGSALSSEATFGYRYDDETPPQEPVAMAAASTRIIDAVPQPVGTSPAVRGVSAAPVTLSTTTSPISLGNETVAVNLKVVPEQSRRLRSPAAPSASAAGAGWIVLEDVEIGPDGAQGGFNYRVVASLPGEADGEARRVVLGSIGTFSLSVEAHEGGDEHAAHTPGGNKQTLSYPLAEILASFQGVSENDLEAGLRISLEPALDAAQSLRTSAAVENVRIGAIKLQLRSGNAQ